MTTIRWIAVVIAAALAAVFAVGYMLPGEVHVERDLAIAAPPSAVFTLLNGFRRFDAWSPWAALDPKAAFERSGPEAGVGAKLSWAGDPKGIGSGSETIVESIPYDLVRSVLALRTGPATVTFRVAPEAGGSRVTWRLDFELGSSPISRYAGLSFDSLLGEDFEKGLARLKALAETLPKVDFAGLVVEEIEALPIPVAYVAAQASDDDDAIAAAIGAAYGQVGRFMAAHSLRQAGPPITINTNWDEPPYEFDAAIPIEGSATGDLGASPVKIKSTYAGKALRVVHRGPYDGMRDTYDKLLAYAAARGLETAAAPWDEYVTDPGETQAADLVTNIYLPVK